MTHFASPGVPLDAPGGAPNKVQGQSPWWEFKGEAHDLQMDKKLSASGVKPSEAEARDYNGGNSAAV